MARPRGYPKKKFHSYTRYELTNLNFLKQSWIFISAKFYPTKLSKLISPTMRMVWSGIFDVKHLTRRKPNDIESTTTDTRL